MLIEWVISIFLWWFLSFSVLFLIFVIQLLESPEKSTGDKGEKDCSIQKFGETWEFVEWNAEHFDIVLLWSLSWSSLLSFSFFSSDFHFFIELLDEFDDVLLVWSQWGIQGISQSWVVNGFEKMEEMSWIEVWVFNEQLKW